MCGIAGLISFDQRHQPTRERLARMSHMIAHRGPDDEGFHISGDGLAGMAFRRLAILDPDPRANQPMSTADGRYSLVFNGEIYNFRALRDELSHELGGYEWRTTGDAEVLLIAYATWGEHCLPKLNGMYAFAVWDDRDKTLFAARDRMGQKPLYYATASNQTIAFASELSAITTLDWIDTTVGPSSLSDYLLVGYIPSPRTIYTGVSKLPPGHWLRFSAGQIITRSYFDAGGYLDSGIGVEHRDLSGPDQTRRLVEQAVQRQMVSDVPIACFLSGGIDSSIIAACMRKQSHDVRTFSIGFDDPRYDESPYAVRVARHLGTRHHQFHVTPSIIDDLPALAEVYGEPFADSSAIPTHYLSHEVSDEVKVALSGDGGDELFGGYERYRAMQLSERINRTPLLGGVARSSIWQHLPGSHPKSRLARLKRFQRSLSLPLELRYPSYVRLFQPDQLPQLFHDDFVLRTDPGLIGDKWYKAFLDHRDPVTAALAIDRVTYLPEDLLTKLDRASMLHSLEVRSPFMDHQLVQFASTLTTDQLLTGGGKRMLREAFASDLPSEVFNRKKMGFALPIGEWFRTSLKSLLHDAIFSDNSFAKAHFNWEYVQTLIDHHQSRRADYSQQLYALLMLEMWWDGRVK